MTLGNTKSIHLQSWPKFDEGAIEQDTFKLIERTSGDIISKFESSVDKVAEARKINKEELYQYFDNEVNEQLGA